MMALLMLLSSITTTAAECACEDRLTRMEAIISEQKAQLKEQGAQLAMLMSRSAEASTLKVEAESGKASFPHPPGRRLTSSSDCMTSVVEDGKCVIKPSATGMPLKLQAD